MVTHSQRAGFRLAGHGNGDCRIRRPHRSEPMPAPKKLIAGVAAALAIMTGSAAYAAIPDAGNVVHACYDKSSGRLRVTDTATNKPKACTKKEGVLAWNTAGGD